MSNAFLNNVAVSTKVYKRANRRLACQQKSREEVTIATGRKAARGFMNKTSTAIIYDFIIDLPSNIKEKKIVFRLKRLYYAW